jgi:hypothetical protein
MKPFLELYKVGFGKEVKKKPTFFKDKDGKMQKTSEDKWLAYVEWATLLVALYRDGEAKKVSYRSDLHKTKPNTLEITVVIDGEEFKTDYPVIDGNAVISSPNQMQLHKAELRGFVKCVAIHTGLGLSLWQKEESLLPDLPTIESQTKQKETEENVNAFLDWVNAIDNCNTVDELGKLYNDNKEAIESSSNVKTLFTKRRVLLQAK